MLQRAEKEKQMLPQLIGTLIIFNSENIVDGIRRRWSFGKDVNDGSIGEYRSSEYKAFKVYSNPKAGGSVDLTLTGALGNGLTIRKKGTKQYEIFSTDYKFKRIADKYGIEQFNLDAIQLDELIDMLYFTAIEEYLDNVYNV
jgi:hypothetical protein